jgi:hypothetical protein
MNKSMDDLISGILQAALPSILAYAVGKGWLPADSVPEVTAAVVTLVCAGWSVHTNRRT